MRLKGYLLKATDGLVAIKVCPHFNYETLNLDCVCLHILSRHSDVEVLACILGTVRKDVMPEKSAF